MFCRKCGTQIDGNVSFCPKCGTKTEVDSGASQEFRTYAPMWSRQEDADAQKPVEPDNEPEKKNNGKKGLIIGIAIGLVVAIIAVVVVLFATGVFGGDSKDGSEKVSVSDTDTAIQNVEYKTVTANLLLLNDSRTEVIEEKEVSFQIPSFEELKRFEDMDLDISEIVADGESFCQYCDDGFLITINYEDENYEFAIEMSYKSDDCKIENINYGSISLGFFANNAEEMAEILFKSYDKKLYYWYCVDDVFEEAFTSSGFKFDSGNFYDDKGNIISEEDFYEECDNMWDSVV